MLGLTRRQLLALGAGLGAAGLAGCSFSSPVVRGGPTAAPTLPAPPPVPGAADGFRLESRCAGLALALAAGSEGGTARRWRAIAEAQTEHARVLARPDPTARVTPGGTTGAATPSPAATPEDVEPSDQQEAVETALAAHRAQASASTATLALLWASLAAFAAALPRAEAIGTEQTGASPSLPPAPPPAAEPDAVAEVVTGLHAAVSGYELALVPLDPTSERWAGARRRLTQLLRLRDDLTAVLAAAGADVPAAPPAYDVELDPSDVPGSTQLRRELELALHPWLGRWVQSAADPTRATEALIASVLTSTDLGADLDPWPGW